MILLGLDPGARGGVAMANLDNGWIGALKMPDTEADLVALLAPNDIQSKLHEWFAFVESVHSMPKQGVASSFKFGQNFGMIRGVLAALGIRREFVTPSKWQKAMGCLSRGDKNVTKRRAQELFPQLRVTHATADALLIMEYGRIVVAQQSGAVPAKQANG